MLRPTLLGREERLGCLLEVVIHPDLTLAQQAVDSGWVAVAHTLVAIQVVPPREVVVAEAADEPGASYPPHVPL